ncbi:MAG: hypothetical protein A2Y38_15665 [Spirochaetes bacterium GWB1_59_5]|nr:MAG: hypothetical protein A2Y38_15665 [Spirochaetes bacterium GWB1_59_5]
MKRFIAYLLITLALVGCGCPEPAQAATNAQSITFLLSQVRNSSGALAGGKVYAYAAGTSTPKTIWLNRSKSTVAANPYTLDSNGTAQLYGDGLYRFVIKTAAGVTVYDRDNVSIKDAIDPLEADVATYGTLSAAVATIGSVTPTTLKYATDQSVTTLTVTDNIHLVGVNGASISFSGTLTIDGPVTNLKTAGAGALVLNGAVNGEPKFRHGGATSGISYAEPDWWDVDGVQDQIQWEAAVAALNIGGVLRSRTKEYIIDDEISVNRSIIIEHYGTIKIKDNSAAGTSSAHTMVEISADNVTFSGGKVDGNMANQSWVWSSVANYGVSTSGKNTIVKDVEIYGVTGNGCGPVTGGDYSTWQNVTSHGNGKKGLHSAAVAGTRIIGGRYYDNEHDSGIGLHQGAYNTTVTGAIAYNNTTYGIHTGESFDIPGANIGNITISGCKVYDNAITNILVARFWDTGGTDEAAVDNRTIITGNHLYYTSQPATDVARYNIEIYNAKGTVIANNILGRGGVLNYNGINTDIHSNQFYADYTNTNPYQIRLSGLAVGGSHASHLITYGTKIRNNVFELSNVTNGIYASETLATEIRNNTFRVITGGTYEIRVNDATSIANTIIDQPSGRVRLGATTYTTGYITSRDVAVGAPASTPAQVGYEYLNSSTGKWYKATCTTSSACWAILN